MNVYAETIDTKEAYRTLFEDNAAVRPLEIIADPALSQEFKANIFLVSELGQHTGAYKFRGSFNWFAHHVNSDTEEVVAFSAGNHAAAVAACAQFFGVKARVFMPENTPVYKQDLVRRLGGNCINVILTGRTVDAAAVAGKDYLDESGLQIGFVHPFDDAAVVSGQGTIGEELNRRLPDLDMLVSPVGGGGLLSGLIHATKHRQGMRYVAAEPAEAASLTHALEGAKEPLVTIDTFVDGAAVCQVGDIILRSLQEVEGRYTVARPDKLTLNRHVSMLWNDGRGLCPELAGALSVAALEDIRPLVEGKTVACVISGGNLSRQRFEEEIKVVQ